MLLRMASFCVLCTAAAASKNPLAPLKLAWLNGRYLSLRRLGAHNIPIVPPPLFVLYIRQVKNEKDKTSGPGYGFVLAHDCFEIVMAPSGTAAKPAPSGALSWP